jgi:hypothetical protein
LLWYPQSLEIPLAIGALVLTTVLVGVLRRRGALTLPRVTVSAVASVVLVVAGAASYAVWRLALLIDPAQVSAVVGEPYRPVLYRFAVLLAGLAAVLSLFAPVCRRLGALGLAVGMLVVLALAGVLLAFTLPGISGQVVQPTLVVAAGAAIAVLLPERRTLARASVYLLALAVAAILLGPAVWVGFDIGLNAGPLSAVLLAIFVTLALPLIEAAWLLPDGTVPRRRAHIAAVPALVVALTAALLTAGLVANREGATNARQEAIVYSVDADTNVARWASGAMPASEWSRSLLSEPAVPLEDAFPWGSAGAALRHRSSADRRAVPTRRDGAQRRHPRRYPGADAAAVVPPRRLDARAVGRRRQRNCSSRDCRRPGRSDRPSPAEVGLWVPLLRGAGGWR